MPAYGPIVRKAHRLSWLNEALACDAPNGDRSFCDGGRFTGHMHSMDSGVFVVSYVYHGGILQRCVEGEQGDPKLPTICDPR